MYHDKRMGRRKGECHTPWCRELGQVSRCKICTLRHFLFSCWMNMFDLLCTLPHTPPRGVNLINLSKNWTRLIFNFQHEVGRRGGELEWNVFYPEIKNWIYLNNYPDKMTDHFPFPLFPHMVQMLHVFW